jgi:hypothetical protein
VAFSASTIVTRLRVATPARHCRHDRRRHRCRTATAADAGMNVRRALQAAPSRDATGYSGMLVATRIEERRVRDPRAKASRER